MVEFSTVQLSEILPDSCRTSEAAPLGEIEPRTANVTSCVSRRVEKSSACSATAKDVVDNLSSLCPLGETFGCGINSLNSF